MQVFVAISNVRMMTLHGKPYFLFPDALKRWSFQKNCAGTWSFLYYRERWYFLFSKILSYILDGKLKMIFLKKIHGNMIFSSHLLKRWCLSKKGRGGTWYFLYHLERWYFFPKNIIFFHWAESEKRPFPGNTWKRDTSPNKEKHETWYIGLKPGFSLNLLGWGYSAINNLQYFVPFSPQGLCLEVCLGANKGIICPLWNRL